MVALSMDHNNNIDMIDNQQQNCMRRHNHEKSKSKVQEQLVGCQSRSYYMILCVPLKSMLRFFTGDGESSSLQKDESSTDTGLGCCNSAEFVFDFEFEFEFEFISAML